jgi:hypothetical protein
MIDLSEYKILRFKYPFSNEELGVMIWDKMNEQEKKWGIKLTLDGINDTGEHNGGSWDIFFLDNRLKSKIEELLIKYSVPYEVEDETNLILGNISLFSDEFIKKLDTFFSEKISVDDVLDHINEVGIEKISIFERYYLKNNVEND